MVELARAATMTVGTSCEGGLNLEPHTPPIDMGVR